MAGNNSIVYICHTVSNKDIFKAAWLKKTFTSMYLLEFKASQDNIGQPCLSNKQTNNPPKECRPCFDIGSYY